MELLLFCGRGTLALRLPADLISVRPKEFFGSQLPLPVPPIRKKKPPFATLQSTQAMFRRSSSGRDPLSQ